MLKYKLHYDLHSKSLGIGPLKVLTTSFFRYNSLKKMKLNRIDASFLVQVLIIKLLENFQKMAGFLKSFCPSISKSLHIDFNASQMFLFSYCLMV